VTEPVLINLTGKQSQIIVEVGEFAEILYWGKPVQGALENYRKSLYRPVPFGRLDKDVSSK